MKINDNTDPAARGLAAYTIQELYEKYDDYLFDWETFYRDPERYTFTEDDIMYWNLRELKNYEFDVPMTPAEKRALRKWVASGHSVHEPRGSRYVIERRIVRRWITHFIYRWTKGYQTVRSHCWPVDRRTDCSLLLPGAN